MKNTLLGTRVGLFTRSSGLPGLDVNIKMATCLQLEEHRLQFWALLNCTRSWTRCIFVCSTLYNLLSISVFLVFSTNAGVINIFFCLVTMTMRSADTMLNWIFCKLLCSPLTSKHHKSSAHDFSFVSQHFFSVCVFMQYLSLLGFVQIVALMSNAYIWLFI